MSSRRKSTTQQLPAAETYDEVRKAVNKEDENKLVANDFLPEKEDNTLSGRYLENKKIEMTFQKPTPGITARKTAIETQINEKQSNDAFSLKTIAGRIFKKILDNDAAKAADTTAVNNDAVEEEEEDEEEDGDDEDSTDKNDPTGGDDIDGADTPKTDNVDSYESDDEKAVINVPEMPAAENKSKTTKEALGNTGTRSSPRLTKNSNPPATSVSASVPSKTMPVSPPSSSSATKPPTSADPKTRISQVLVTAITPPKNSIVGKGKERENGGSAVALPSTAKSTSGSVSEDDDDTGDDYSDESQGRYMIDDGSQPSQESVDAMSMGTFTATLMNDKWSGSAFLMSRFVYEFDAQQRRKYRFVKTLNIVLDNSIAIPLWYEGRANAPEITVTAKLFGNEVIVKDENIIVAKKRNGKIAQLTVIIP